MPKIPRRSVVSQGLQQAKAERIERFKRIQEERKNKERIKKDKEKEKRRIQRENPELFGTNWAATSKGAVKKQPSKPRSKKDDILRGPLTVKRIREEIAKDNAKKRAKIIKKTKKDPNQKEFDF